MKTTTQNISKILATLLIALTVALLYPAHANVSNKKLSAASQMMNPSLSADDGRDESLPTATSGSNQMLDDPKYWVNYLKNNVNPNDDENLNTASDLNEMENNPEYWINSLKHIVTEE